MTQSRTKNTKDTPSQTTENKNKINPERKMAFESLPPHMRENMTDEEIELFLYAKEWPESMFKKFDEFIFTK
ncbi:MAG: hypothetical protein HQK62_00180 [Desulfamplus sp.]|nr:hypothetical protein [Desulfamplus sp.]MBF0257248.1 hypothetical protein [Desulfamplus sp.]